MVWRTDDWPSIDQANQRRPITEMVGWLCWIATGTGPPFTTWERLSSKTHTWTDIPVDRLLGFRVFYSTSLNSDPTAVYSDVCYGWDWYAFQALQGGKKIRYWRADNEAELDQHRSGPSRKYAGASMTDPVWDQVEADIMLRAHANGWI